MTVDVAAGFERRRSIFGWLAGIGFVLLGLALVWLIVVRALGSDGDFSVQLQGFVTITLSIVTEALPFVILGVLLSSFVHFFVPGEAIIRVLPRRAGLRRMALSTTGIFLPVCECGNVPVVRELLRKGLTPAEATTFLLAAPIANPITILSTWAAFSYAPGIPVMRLLGGLLIANMIGWWVALMRNQQRILTTRFVDSCNVPHTQKRSVFAFADMFRRELGLLLGTLCFGAMIAAASQIFIPTEVLTSVGDTILISVLAMMVLAFVISICASFDAFFALAYASTFSSGSLLAFMLFGPMIDIKMLVMLKTTYRGKFLLALSIAVAVLVLIISINFNFAIQMFGLGGG